MRKSFLSLFFISGLIVCPLAPVSAEQVIYGEIDFVDFAVFAARWLDNDCGACGGANFTSDEIVDGNDLRILAANWLNPPPQVIITSPNDGATVSSAPITVSGTVDQACDVIVNSVHATVDFNSLTFSANNVDICFGENIITATTYGFAGISSSNSISVTSTVTSCYSIFKVTSDIYEYDPTNIVAGSQVSLKVLVELDGVPASGEPVEFLITQGSGSMVQVVVNTDPNGEATGMLNTDPNASVTNLVEVFDQNFLGKTVTFHIDTKAGFPGNLVKLTDDSNNVTPGAEIDLIVRLEDSNSNTVPDEEIAYQITSGPGALSPNDVNTNEYGFTKTSLTTTISPNTPCTIQAQSTSNPSLTVTFNITTSNVLTVDVNDIIDRVTANDQLIQDIMADINVTSNAPWLSPTTQLKIWQKGDKQKVQEISPSPSIYIRPPADTNTLVNMTRTIISYEPITEIYVIKSVQEGQTDEYPYQLDYIEYSKGVIIKTEQYIKDGDHISRFVTEYFDFVNIDGIWGFQTMVEAVYDESGTQLYSTTSTYTNIAINTGIPDSVFE